MRTFIIAFHLIVSLLLIGVVLLQMQGTGLTGALGTEGSFYRSKRSVEKFLFRATCVLAGFFALLSVALLIVP
jgi:protein translocase SecG subunit